MGWTEYVARAPMEWLLEPENPSVRALTLTELLDRDTQDGEVVEARYGIAHAPYTAHILSDQHPDGHWGRPERYFQKHTGTAWRWLLLHELGYDPLHSQMQRAAEFLLDIAFSQEQGADALPYPKIDTTHLTTEQTADRVLEIVQGNTRSDKP